MYYNCVPQGIIINVIYENVISIIVIYRILQH